MVVHNSAHFLPSLLLLFLLPVAQCGVTYDRKAIVINGQRRILISGSIHYPRSTPDMWEGLIQKAKDGGLDVIQTYVFWNGHEPSPGTYNFEGRYDLVRFVKTVQKSGLYVHLRIGPYVCAEWNFGGFPVWLKYVPGISFRTDNEPSKVHSYISNFSLLFDFFSWEERTSLFYRDGVGRTCSFLGSLLPPGPSDPRTCFLSKLLRTDATERNINCTPQLIKWIPRAL